MIHQSKIKELRNKNDKYLTPFSVIQQLLDYKTDIPKDASIFEPCCSNEKIIINTLEKNGFNNLSYNIFDEDKPETNFLLFDETKQFDYIITNTPYGKIAIDFIAKMKKIASKQVIALYNFNTLTGKNNFEKIWSDNDYKLKEIYIFIRPCWLMNTVREDGKYKTGINGYAWFIWDKEYKGEPILKHIDNNRFVLSKGD
jgi:hypothetical protein